MSSLRDAILATDDIQKEPLLVPEWGVTVEVRGMSGAARADMMENAADEDGGLSFRSFYPEIVILCTFDPETGEQVFEAGDRDAVLSKSGSAINRIAEVGLRLSGMDKESRTEAGKDSR